MPFKTPQEYFEDMKRMKRTIYAYGEKVTNPVEHPLIRPTMECVAKTYEAARVTEFEEVMVAHSHITGEKTNIFNITYENKEDLLQRCKAQRLIPRLTGYCSYRCLGATLLSSIFDLTFELDQRHGTEYNHRFREYLKLVEKNDWTVSEAMTDVKGDRSKHPSEQPDLDHHVHIVERREDGIVVRGAKAHQSGAVASHEHIIAPTRTLTKDEEDFAVVCAIPGDAKGIIHVFQGGPEEAKILAGDSGNVKYGTCTTSLMILDNVFVPWNRVFMCGEYEMTGSYILERYTPLHRINGSTCKGGFFDVLVGALHALSEHSGIPKASHIRDKIADLISIGEICYGTGVASCVLGYKAPSGIVIPNPEMGNASKIFAGTHLYEAARLATDLAGGLVATVPSWKDYYNPETRTYLDKYLKGAADTSTENRIRLFKFIQTMIVESPYCPNVVLGAGTAEVARIGLTYNTDLEQKKRFAEVVCGMKAEETMPRSEYIHGLEY